MTIERFTSSQTDALASDADLTGKEFYAAKRTATGVALCVAGDHCDGVISEGKAVGLHTSIKTGNQVKAIAGAAVAIGAKVSPNAAGKFITAASGAEVFGTAASAAGAANDLITIDIDRSNADLA